MYVFLWEETIIRLLVVCINYYMRGWTSIYHVNQMATWLLCKDFEQELRKICKWQHWQRVLFQGGMFFLWANLLHRLLCQYVGDVLAYCPTVRSSDGLSVGPFQWLRCALLMAPRDSRASLIALRLASQTAPLVLLDGNVEPHEWLQWATQIAPLRWASLGLHRLGFSDGL